MNDTTNLPPLPQPEFDNLLDHIYEYGTLAEGTIPRARALCEAYARAAILAERERCVDLVLCELGVTGQAHAIAAAIREGDK